MLCLKRWAALAGVCVLSLAQAWARQEKSLCGSYRDRGKEERHLHARMAARTISPAAALPDSGEIAIIEDSGGVAARRNPFDLDHRTVQFLPANLDASQYRVQISAASYDAAAAAAGSPIPLGDDDSAAVNLPFPFLFFGASYTAIYVNSDGNLSFGAGDSEAAQRSLGRIVAGPPRIAPLFMDLDPSRLPGSVRALAEPGRFVVSWAGAPAYSDASTGAAETFQARLYPDGRIEFAYNGITTDGAVAGISPGGGLGDTSVISFSANPTAVYAGTVAETFGGRDEIDTIAAARKFYQTHDDTYDYLVFYNNEGIGACPGAISCEVTVRNHRSGYGDIAVESGQEYGSAGRLQAALNMGPLAQYPADPNAPVPARSGAGDTPVTLLGHESGHLFLAYASIRDPADPAARPMLGSQLAHWAFTFDSEASLLEGNRIEDEGSGASPRFLTTGAVQQYAPLDQYLMGFRAPEEVDPVFLVNGPSRAFALQLPHTGVAFDGQRQDIGLDQIVAAEGRRTPDSTVSQRRFRWAFVLIVPAGTQPSMADLSQIDGYRRRFETFYGEAASGRAVADTSLRLSLTLSTFPAAGVLAGNTIPVSISIQAPAAAPLTITLATQTGAIASDPAVTIPAGASSAVFQVTGVRAGVDEIDAQPADARYDAAISRIQVLGGSDDATVQMAPGDRASAVLRITDINNLPYPAVTVQSASGDSAITDGNGQAQFSARPGETLSLQIAGASAPFFVPAGGAFRFFAPVNAASGAPGLSPGEIASVHGAGFAGDSQALLDGNPCVVLFASDSRIDFLVPDSQSVGITRLTVVSNGVPALMPAPVPVALFSPGIFFDPATGYGAVLAAGTGLNTRDRPAAPGDSVEIYATGLGISKGAQAPPEVTIAGAPAAVLYSGPSPGFPGLYQVNARIPDGAMPGVRQLSLSAGGVQSNIVLVGIR